MRHDTQINPYRVGLGRDLHSYNANVTLYGPKSATKMFLNYVRRSWRRRSYWGLWQAEWTGCHRAVRGLTQEGCRRRAIRARAIRQWRDIRWCPSCHRRAVLDPEYPGCPECVVLAGGVAERPSRPASSPEGESES